MIFFRSWKVISLWTLHHMRKRSRGFFFFRIYSEEKRNRENGIPMALSHPTMRTSSIFRAGISWEITRILGAVRNRISSTRMCSILHTPYPARVYRLRSADSWHGAIRAAYSDARSCLPFVLFPARIIKPDVVLNSGESPGDRTNLPPRYLVTRRNRE